MSSEDSSSYRAAAAAAIADADYLNLADNDRTVVLKALVDARLAQVEAAPPSTTENGSAPSEERLDGSDGEVLTGLGRALGLDLEVIEQVYSVIDGEPVLVVPPSKLPGDKSGATRTICQLLAAARQLADVEDWSSASVLRAIVTEFGAFDQNNFAAHMRSLGDIAVFRGQGRAREMRITRPGIEATRALIRSLTTEKVGD